MTSASTSPTSPCVRLCILDDAGGTCTGCGRTIGEIASWPGLSDEARSAITSELGERLRRRSAGRV